MDSEEPTSKITSLVRQNLLPIAVGLAGLIFFGYGLILFLGSNSKPSSIVLENANKVEPEAKIMVDVEGAVTKPGSYELAQNARVQDALVAASGLSALADREWISKNINLASKLKDGAKIYIPQKGENISQSVSSSVETKSEAIDINSASVEELDSLWGIGPATANKIIQARPYSMIDDLIKKKIVSQKIFDKIKDTIVAQ